MKRIFRDRRQYDDSKETVCCLRPLNTEGQIIGVGDVVSKEITDEATRRRWWAAGRICYKSEFEPVNTGPETNDHGETEEQEKERLIMAIREAGGRASRNKKLENLRKQAQEMGVDTPPNPDDEPSGNDGDDDNSDDSEISSSENPEDVTLKVDEEASQELAERLKDLSEKAEAGDQEAIDALAELKASAGELDASDSSENPEE